MQYDYGFQYSFPEGMEGFAQGAMTGALGIFLGIFLIIYFLIMAVGIVSYVLGSLGMYRIAKRRGIHHAWLAWLPVGNTWLLGSISDHYQYVVKHKHTSRRKILLWLNVATCFAGILFGVGAVVTAIAGETSGGAVVSAAVGFIGWLTMMVIAVAATVFCYIAYYDLFQSCRPDSSVLFLVLGIFFNITLPFFVFGCSKYDKGMPAKRTQQAPVQIPEPVAAPVPAPAPDPVPEPVRETVSEPEMAAEEELPVVETEIVEEIEE